MIMIIRVNSGITIEQVFIESSVTSNISGRDNIIAQGDVNLLVSCWRINDK